jgi:hypothetical protein
MSPLFTKESFLTKWFCQISQILQTDRWSVVGMKFSIGLLTVKSWLCSFCSLPDFEQSLPCGPHHPSDHDQYFKFNCVLQVLAHQGSQYLSKP